MPDKDPELEAILATCRPVTESSPELRAFAEYQATHPHRYEPALFLEAETGLTGIAGRYTFPSESGFTRLELEHTTSEIIKSADFGSIETRRFLTEAMDTLKKHNPHLEHLKYKETENGEIWDAVRGVVSGFNVDDINFFIRTDFAMHPERVAADRLKDPLNAKLIERFGLKGIIQWCPAPETLAKIEEQVARMPELPALEVVAKTIAQTTKGLHL